MFDKVFVGAMQMQMPKSWRYANAGFGNTVLFICHGATRPVAIPKGPAVLKRRCSKFTMPSKLTIAQWFAMATPLRWHRFPGFCMHFFPSKRASQRSSEYVSSCVLGFFAKGFSRKCLHWRGDFWKKFLWDLQEKIRSEHRKHKTKLCAEVPERPLPKDPFFFSCWIWGA